MREGLWSWAVREYQKPAVADACLELQDQDGASVCELLWCAWLAQSDHAPNAQGLSEFRRFRRGLYLAIERLRGARRLLELDPLTRELGTRTRPLEIDTEALLLTQLEALPGEPLNGRRPLDCLHAIDAAIPSLAPSEATQRRYRQLMERLGAAEV
ncbi:TIGR02444 family protein [Litorivicinus lipolyticus]|uniref:TIGR02444 family protein n=1 Tax=Litorivicinus lipolyticus TaxID=418701 RepID=A0A5Q2QAH0_9GAMM|nr:TIGR02444 family protein [Litorivicinus lipolyticus]QGG79046.1 TIGR02444 family protein [Litorivicinus lipolyticus]